MNVVIDPQIRALMESAATGLAAKEFMASGFGKYLVEKAATEVDEALAELVEANPNDSETIKSIQNRIRVAQSAINWLMDSITEGENAMRELDQD